MATDYASMIPKEDLASFQKANPGKSFTVEDYSAYNDPNSYVYKMNSLPTNNSTINSQNLAQGASVKIPTYQPTPVDPSIAQGAIASVAGQYEALNKQQEQAQAEQKAQAESQLSLQNALLGRTADTQTFQEQAGVNEARRQQNELTTQLANLYGQASSLQREAQAIPIANRLQYQQGGVAGTESQIKNVNYDQLQQNALKALSIAQQADIASAALTGSQLKLQEAKDKAQQMVDLKYKPLEDQLAIKKNQYELNKDILSQIDKKRTEALNAAIKKEEQQLADQKANEKGISDLVTNAAGQGAPADLRARAAKAKTPMEAANILGQFAGNYWAIEKTKAEVLKTRAEANAKSATGTGTVSATGTYIKGSDPQAEAWASRIANKQAKLSDVPSAIRTRVAMAMGSSPESTAKADETKQRMIAILSRLQGYKGVATGPKAQMFPVASQVDLPIPFSGVNQTSDALADAEALSALLTTENIALMKGLGSMSNIEFGNIEKIGSSILGRDKEGNAYFKGSKENYNREVKRLLDDLNKLPEMTQTSTPVPPTQSKWTQGDVQSAPTPLSSMAKKDYINPKSPFGTVDFNLPTKP